ncbi:MAG: hypothetical protein QM805_27285 [Pseudomonas sp.]
MLAAVDHADQQDHHGQADGRGHLQSVCGHHEYHPMKSVTA